MIILYCGFCYRGISWCDESLALVYESWYKTRKTRTWVVAPDQKGVDPRILFDRSSEDVYSDPGSPMMRRTATGTYVIAKIKKDGDDHTYLLLNGMGATPEGNIPFLDLFDMYGPLPFCHLMHFEESLLYSLVKDFGLYKILWFGHVYWRQHLFFLWDNGMQSRNKGANSSSLHLFWFLQ